MEVLPWGMSWSWCTGEEEDMRCWRVVYLRVAPRGRRLCTAMRRIDEDKDEVH